MRKIKMPKYDATPLLYKNSESDRFIDKLNISEDHEAIMLKARRLARNKIKSAFTKARTDDQILSNLNKDERSALQSLEPRFYPQGSYVYKTQNAPERRPQQVDLDDGAYLPIEIMRDRPILNKNIFFKIVDSALEELAKEQGWQFKKKDTCARLIITNEVHLDIPLYAIPKDRFIDLQKAEGRTAKLDEAQKFTESKRLLSEDEIYLARRDNEHWTKSDPMEIREWFLDSIKMHGEILRRVCRYLKTWRDVEWISGGPSSIALMICATEVFDNNHSGFTNDSSAIAAVLKSLPDMLNNGIKNPKNQDELIFPRGHDENEIKNIVDKARIASNDILSVLNHGASATEVLNTFKKYFGRRVPDQKGWILHLGTAASAAAAVQATPARKTNEPKFSDNMIAG